MQYLNNYVGLLVIIKISHSTDFEQVIIKISNFGDSITLSKKILSKKKLLVKTLSKNP